MRALVILCCLATSAYAASLGYDYERNTGSVSGGDGGAISSGFDNLSGPIAAGGSGGGSFGVGPAEVSKEFYTYTAPEAEFDDGDAHNQLSDSLKKNLRVIFIKGPESSGLENAALQLAKSAGDERTAIYVLNKQADISDLANKLNSLNNHNANRPEVHFVKYRTPADAENAKRTIQQQYDSLGGHSNSHDGGVAPVLDFASKAPIASGSYSSHGGSAGLGGGNAYLPPNRRI